nr:hypothetical protein [Tanacetum cinerariifolium]
QELNMRQRRWLELLKDYDTNIQYNPGKANVVADALSKKSGMIAGIKVEEEIIRDLERLGIELYVHGHHGYWASLRIEPDLISRIKEAQKEDSEIWTIVENLDKQVMFRLDDDYVLWQDTRLVVPNDVSLREALLTEAHSSPFSVHPGLPQTQRRHDAIWVVVDRLTKSAHFLPIRKDYSVSSLAEIFQQEIVRLHGTPSEIVGERVIEGPEMIEVTNAKVAVAKEKLKEARTRQKSYADKHRRALEFQPGDHVFLKVSPARGVRRSGIKGKLSPRFIGPFEILDQVEDTSIILFMLLHSLEEPSRAGGHLGNRRVYPDFLSSFPSMIGYKYYPLHVITYPLDQIQTDLSYVEEPEAIIDRQDRIMRKKTIPFVKILRRNHPEREATWETEESIRTSYPHFLP